MKKKTTNLGLYLIIIGTLALILTRVGQLSSHNSLLLGGLICIVLGIVLHIRSIKKQGEY